MAVARDVLRLVRKYSPEQDRDYHGRWTATGAGGTMGELEAPPQTGQYNDVVTRAEDAAKDAKALSSPLTQAQAAGNDLRSEDYSGTLDSIDTKKFINQTLATDIAKALDTDPKLAAWADRQAKARGLDANNTNPVGKKAFWLNKVGVDWEKTKTVVDTATKGWEAQQARWTEQVNVALGRTAEVPTMSVADLKVGDTIAMARDALSATEENGPLTRLGTITSIEPNAMPIFNGHGVTVHYEVPDRPGGEPKFYQQAAQVGGENFVHIQDIVAGDVVSSGVKGDRFVVGDIDKGSYSGEFTTLHAVGENQGALTSTGGVFYWGHEPARGEAWLSTEDTIPTALSVPNQKLDPWDPTLFELAHFQNDTAINGEHNDFTSHVRRLVGDAADGNAEIGDRLRALPVHPSVPNAGQDMVDPDAHMKIFNGHGNYGIKEPSIDDVVWQVPKEPMPADMRQVIIGERVRQYTDTWAGSSGDSKTDSIALQRAAASVFGLPTSVMTRLREYAEAHDTTDSVGGSAWEAATAQLKSDRPFLEHFVKAMYDNTQTELTKRGIGPHDRVLLQRGMHMDPLHAPHWALPPYQLAPNLAELDGGQPVYFTTDIPADRTIRLNPLSAWSSSESQARNFSQMGGTDERGLLISSYVPRERIFSLASSTGIGCLNEEEIIVLGGRGRASVKWDSNWIDGSGSSSYWDEMTAKLTGKPYEPGEDMSAIDAEGKTLPPQTMPDTALNIGDHFNSYGWNTITGLDMQDNGETLVHYVNEEKGYKGAEITHGTELVHYGYKPKADDAPGAPQIHLASHTAAGEVVAFAPGGIEYTVTDVAAKPPWNDIKVKTSTGDEFTLKPDQVVYSHNAAEPPATQSPYYHKTPLIQTAASVIPGDIIKIGDGVPQVVAGIASGPKDPTKLTFDFTDGSSTFIMAHNDVYWHGTVGGEKSEEGKKDYNQPGMHAKDKATKLISAYTADGGTTDVSHDAAEAYFAAHYKEKWESVAPSAIIGWAEKQPSLKPYLTKATDDDDDDMLLDADPADADWIKFLGHDVGMDGSLIVGTMTGLGARRVRKYNPDEPRDDHGRWTSGGASSDTKTEPKPTPSSTSKPESKPSSKPSQSAPIHATNVDQAIRLLARGYKVELEQPRQVSTLLHKLANIVADAKAKGLDSPKYNLCDVSVEGTNLFCAESKGIPRIQMPQFSGIPVPGSLADNLPKDTKGEVNLTALFRDQLLGSGVKVTDTVEKASYLRASQNELVGAKVAGMVRALEAGTMKPGAIFTTTDNYIVDGHHRWAANVGWDLEDGHAGDVSMPIVQIDMPILDVLAAANDFADTWGIAPKVGKAARLLANLRVAKYSDEQPRGENGQWVKSAVRLEGAGTRSGDYCFDHGMQAKVASEREGKRPTIAYHQGRGGDMERFGRGAATAANPCRTCLRHGVDALVKYNEDQERDDHGRWSTAGHILSMIAGGIAGLTNPEYIPGDTLADWSGPLDRPTGRIITPSEARGDSRGISYHDFHILSIQGERMLKAMHKDSSPPTGITDNRERIVDRAVTEAHKSWGGVTIDAHTGEEIHRESGYALTVKAPGQHSIVLPESASHEEMDWAVREALSRFPQLNNAQHALGIFHDDDHHRIDVDPVLIVDTTHQVDAIGTFTHAIGGAYDFATGNGHFPPHVVMGGHVREREKVGKGKRDTVKRRPIEGRRVSMAEFFAQERDPDRPIETPVKKMDPAPVDVHTDTTPKKSKKKTRRLGPFILDMVRKYNADEARDYHGRWTAGGADTEAGKPLRIAPISGTGPRGSVAADLTLADLPPKTAAQSTERFVTGLGLNPTSAVSHMVAMASTMSHEAQADAAQWYDRAHDFGYGYAAQFGLDPHIGVAIVAACSPGQLWEVNKLTAVMVAEAFGARDTVVSQELADKINPKLGTRGENREFRVKAGMTYGEVFAASNRAGAVLIGRANGLQLRSYDNLTKAVELARSNKAEDIDHILTGAKVRSFFNCMENPRGDDVCVDVHMQRAMANGVDAPGGHDRMRMVEKNQTAIVSTPSYRNANVGAYPVMADAVREATRQFNEANHTSYVPSQFQAIVWTKEIEAYPLARIRRVLEGGRVRLS